MLGHVLIPESVVRATEPEVATLVPTLDPRVIIDWSHPTYGPAFLHFMLFDQWPYLLGESQPAAEEVRFYNMYYWYCKFANLYCGLHGRDVGLEQRGFQLLESTETVSGNIDWAIVEEIYRLFPYEQEAK